MDMDTNTTFLHSHCLTIATVCTLDKLWTLESVQVQLLSKVKHFGLWALYIRQSLDKLCIIMSILCPFSLLLDRNCTNSVPHWTECGQSLYFTIYWTDIWQGLDRDWSEIGFGVQSLSNHPRYRSTHIGSQTDWPGTVPTQPDSDHERATLYLSPSTERVPLWQIDLFCDAHSPSPLAPLRSPAPSLPRFPSFDRRLSTASVGDVSLQTISIPHSGLAEVPDWRLYLSFCRPTISILP